jgi:phenylalanyl-tRNA synthetase beta chain
MDVSLNWLKNYVSLDGLDTNQIAAALTDIGLEVEAIKNAADFPDSVVVGRILSAIKHPNADTLQVCQVDIGPKASPLTIVCGAPNARKDLTVAVATVGSTLPGDFKIKEAKIRGEASFGMLCSSKELGLSTENAGIMELSSALTLGTPVRTALGLDDVVLTLNVTPNRADCLGHIGVARDLSAKLLRKVCLPTSSPKTSSSHQSKDIGIHIESDRCTRFCALSIKNIKVVKSPEWLASRLQLCGMRPINLIVDVTNYVMLEMNQPIHAYDERAVEGRSFVIREAKDNEVFVTLDGTSRSLKAGDLLICDKNRAIGLAGIMGGLTSEITDDTSSLILEVASFDPNTIRATSKRLGLHTEASHRFERGIDTLNCEIVAKRFAQLLQKCVSELQASGVSLPDPVVSSDIADVFPTKPQPKLIALRLTEAKQFLAMPHLTHEIIKKSFDGLGLRLVDQNQDRMVFEVPPWRVDIERECDLIEEVGRLQGYDKVPLSMPVMSLLPTPEDPFIEFCDHIRVATAEQGFRETISFPFWSEQDAAKLEIATGHPLAPTIRLVNPIAEDACLMQTTLSLALIKACHLNRRHGLKGSRLFELGRGYFDFAGYPLKSDKNAEWRSLDRKGRHLTSKAKEETRRPTERHWLGGILDQPLCPKSWSSHEVPATFFDAKQMLLSLMQAFSVPNITLVRPSEASLPMLHPTASAFIMSGSRVLGWLGELHPKIALEFDFDIQERPLLFEVDLESFFEARESKPHISTESFRFPPSTRDLALLIDESVTHDSMEQAIFGFPNKKHLRSSHLFDVYQGTNIPSGKKSVAWRFSFQSPQETLTDQAVEAEFKTLSQYLQKTFQAEQR